jgi:hypothetical protein
VCLEGGLYGLLWCLPTSLYYAPPTRTAFLRYLAGALDWEVGWRPEPATLAPGGYRLAPAGEGLTTPCVSLYGDSFTFGYEVAPAFAWGNLLTARLGCRVDNYGVAGYGTDQAYLYFQQHQRHGQDTAPVVLLSHLSENIVRNITQNHALLYENILAWKPRFVVAPGGELRLIPMPHLTPDDYEAYRRDPGQFFPLDALLPDSGPLSKRRPFFPYTLSVPYLFTYKRLYASLLFYARTVPPWFAELYDATHPSQALQITRDILLQFGHEARRYGKHPLIFVIPTARDLLYFQSTQQWSYAPLLAMLHAQQVVEVVHLGPLLLARAQDKDLCAYFCTHPLTRSGHYTIKGNKLLAEVAWDILQGRVSTFGTNPQ